MKKKNRHEGGDRLGTEHGAPLVKRHRASRASH